ncbi:MrpF/PhaF family protein [Streptomyces vietnamensis]|uniref:MrpF/PhaF family protein n=1 Tax=Streptomyces vietnamensis TaxID=362257 RepID=UPI0006986D53|nr:MrpF/PhaF family protein [Streptomyces vietnamensis]
MNAWAVAALVLLAVPAPACLWVAARGSAVHRLVGASLLSSVTGAVFLLLPQAYDRSSYQDLALVLGVLAPAGALVFTRFVSGRHHETHGSATDT